MIRITKGDAPAVLLTRGVSGYAEITASITAGKKPAFRRAIYAHKTVKAALRLAQYGKCAFCESNYEHVAFGDVEHFRPKAGFSQSAGENLEKPGYFWLTYDWDNLFLSCTLCNQQFKLNLFPLRDPTQRCRQPDHPLTRETPLLIHPGSDNPELYITFVGETAKPRRGGGAFKGKITIEALGLNRDPLRNKRLEVFERLKHLVELKHLCSLQNNLSNQAQCTKIDSILAAAQLPSAEYSAMAKAYLDQQA